MSCSKMALKRFGYGIDLAASLWSGQRLYSLWSGSSAVGDPRSLSAWTGAGYVLGTTFTVYHFIIQLYTSN